MIVALKESGRYKVFVHDFEATALFRDGLLVPEGRYSPMEDALAKLAIQEALAREPEFEKSGLIKLAL